MKIRASKEILSQNKAIIKNDKDLKHSFLYFLKILQIKKSENGPKKING